MISSFSISSTKTINALRLSVIQLWIISVIAFSAPLVFASHAIFLHFQLTFPEPVLISYFSISLLFSLSAILLGRFTRISGKRRQQSNMVVNAEFKPMRASRILGIVAKINVLLNIGAVLLSFLVVGLPAEIESSDMSKLIPLLLLISNSLIVYTSKSHHFSFARFPPLDIVVCLLSPFCIGVLFQSRTAFLITALPSLGLFLRLHSRHVIKYFSLELRMPSLYPVVYFVAAYLTLSVISSSRIENLSDAAKQTFETSYNIGFTSLTDYLDPFLLTVVVYVSTSFVNGLLMHEYIGENLLLGQLSFYLPSAFFSRLICDLPFCGSRSLLEGFRTFYAGTAYSVSWFTLPMGMILDFGPVLAVFFAMFYICLIITHSYLCVCIRINYLRQLGATLLVFLSVLSLAGGLFVIWPPLLMFYGILIADSICSRVNL